MTVLVFLVPVLQMGTSEECQSADKKTFKVSSLLENMIKDGKGVLCEQQL